ncbi:Fic family protein [Zavarzinia compransoris]|nr:Fic family protein [Zavarzinia compransoris]
MAVDIAGAVRELARDYDPDLVTRAVNFLYTKETRSSFAIEGERPTAQRAARFTAILREAAAFDPTDKAQLIWLQGQIVDPRYAATDWRDFQNFVGETTTDFAERIHYICPRPEDVSRLMLGWQKLAYSLLFLEHEIDPVIAAAVISFAFVFIHPFEDGNGRIHRFLIHNTLATHDITPKGLIFPVSAAILRQKHDYDRVLERFSAPLFGVIDWSLKGGEMRVHHDTGPLYRYFDATAQAEFLYDRVIDTIANDFRQELGFLAVFDKATAAMREIVDMPDRRLHLFFKLCMQNAGVLSKAKRADFPELTDAEVAALEKAIADARGET